MRVTELKALAGDHGLRNYSRMRKAELVALLQNNPPPAPRTPVPRRPPPPPPQMSTWEPMDNRLRPDRPAPRRRRQPTQQEMDIFEQEEMSKSRPQVKNKLNDWYDWLVNHVPKPIKDGASKAFITFKNKIMGLYNRVTDNQIKWEGPKGPATASASGELNEPESVYFQIT